MVVGVTNGFAKDLEIVGVGYRVTPKGPTTLELALGYSPFHHGGGSFGDNLRGALGHRITVRGNDKQAVAKWQPRSASSARLSPTRARACVYGRRSGPGARPARRRSEDHMSNVKDKQSARTRRHFRVRKKVHGTEGGARVSPSSAPTSTL